MKDYLLDEPECATELRERFEALRLQAYLDRTACFADDEE